MKLNIRDLFDNLNPEAYTDIEIKNIAIGDPSLENVKRKVFENIDETVRNKKGIKKSFRGAWIAAVIIFALGTTVFAFNRPEFFKWIFGENAKISEENIQDIIGTASDDNIIFTVESLLSDGSRNYFIISLEKKDGEEIKDNVLPMIGIDIDMEKRGSMSIGSREIKGPNDSKSKKYYLFELNASENFTGRNAKLRLTGLREKNSQNTEKLKKALEVSFKIEDNNINNERIINIEEPEIIDEKYYVTEVRLTNLGISLKGKEIKKTSEVRETKNGIKYNPIPIAKVDLKYKDGKIRNISQYKTSQTPDVDFHNGSHAYSRDQNKMEFTNTLTFGEIVDIKDLEAIIVDGKEYRIDE